MTGESSHVPALSRRIVPAPVAGETRCVGRTARGAAKTLPAPCRAQLPTIVFERTIYAVVAVFAATSTRYDFFFAIVRPDARTFTVQSRPSGEAP